MIVAVSREGQMYKDHERYYRGINKEDKQPRKAGRPVKRERPAFVGFTETSLQGMPIPLPPVWVNVCAEIDNMAELKVVLYVFFHTWGAARGYENACHITLDEFVNGKKSSTGERLDLGTGLSKSAVKDGLARAIQHRLLICFVDYSNKNQIKKYYMLHTQNEECKVQS